MDTGEAAPADVTTAPGNSSFTIAGLASPQLLPRLLGLFAQQDLLPLHLRMDRDTDMMVLYIVQDALDERRAGIILERMRVLPEVSSASLASGEPTPAATVPERACGNG